ncbi:MAG: hypothetical protein RIS54_879 [Verrucomicrobiota bacterium]|jgi:antagonist of KipI
MAVKVIKPGMLSTVQDLGRPGLRATGLPPGGAVDAFSLHLANLLVGNAPGVAGLEMTLVGAELEFQTDAIIAATGAPMGGPTPWRPHAIKAGERVKFGAATRGCRTYLAVAGGFDVPKVLGGRGTDLRAGLGGLGGRALAKGDVLPIGAGAKTIVGRWSVDPTIFPQIGEEVVLRTVVGAEAAEISGGISRGEFTVSPQSDRMGLRLTGPGLVRRTNAELVSSAVAPGTVQVPPDGAPIVLLADAQTIGGYPRIAHVIRADQPLLAQLRPGDRVRFRNVKLAEAHRLWREQARTLALVQQGLRGKLR